jgi:multidrug efflux pump subunit AcrB
VKGQFAGRLADAFLHSKLTPLLLVAALGIGLWTTFTLPSEEEPQINVPIADIYLPLPGRTPAEIENRALIPLEEAVSGIQGVQYVYSHASPGFGLVTVRFEVGREMEESMVRLFTTLAKHADRMPPDLRMPLIKAVSIDDVPFFTVAVHSPLYDHLTLRQIAEEIAVAFESVPDVRDVRVVGGTPREIRVELRTADLAAHEMDPGLVVQRLSQADVASDAGSLTADGQIVTVKAGPFLRTVEDVSKVVLDVRDGRLVQLADVADVKDGVADIDNYTFAGRPGRELAPMVALAVSKRAGADATAVGRALEERLHELEGRVIPVDVQASVTRNYGETAREKVSTLKEHLGLAVLSVGLVVALTMGWRGALVVMMAVPITFSLTLFVYGILGYTLNRITLFALIFVTGIVIDDSIIVAENMERHFRIGGKSLKELARTAVDEVGNPTILATLTVIAAVLPMLFVSGLMGPYMSPMPIGASLAMTFSLLVGLIATPWLAFRMLGSHVGTGDPETYSVEQTKIYRAYAWLMEPLLDKPKRLTATLAGIGLLLVAATALFVTRAVVVKMLPFDDKNEIQLIADLPEGTPLEESAALASELAHVLAGVPEVERLQVYVGVAAPVNFNGLVRHYYLRRGPNVADINLELVDKADRRAKSHDIAKQIRPLVARAVAEFSGEASVKVVEVPPGPPVLSTLVAEVFGPDADARRSVAAQVLEFFRDYDGIVDADWSVVAPQNELNIEVDEERAALSGVPKGRIIEALSIGLGGRIATHLADANARSPVPVRVRLAEQDRSTLSRLTALHVASVSGEMVPVDELVQTTVGGVPESIDRKNGQAVVYVTADVAGAVESPVYAILDVKEQIDESGVAQLFTRQPDGTDQSVVKWDGEWQVTYEVFRDLGIAFAGALLLIYALLVAWFGSFTTPLVMMAAIPLTLVGIGPGHMVFGAFFTATSMIGMIALAGIMVRNGILLIDYLEARRAAGVPLRQAVIEAGAVRARPIALTAGTVVIGAIVILFDPIFEGLAVSLIAGSLASTVLTLVVVPGIYFMVNRSSESI